MPADQIWRLYPRAVGRPDTEFHSLWVEDVSVRGGPAIAPILRTRAVAIGKDGRLETVTTREPLETRAVRIRWRDDVGIDSFLTDPDGAVWLVNGILAVGRRQWLEVSLTHWESGEIDVDPPVAFTPPAGWTLQAADGAPVQRLAVGLAFGEHGTRFVYFKVPTAGFQLGDGFDPTGRYVADDSQGRDTVISFSRRTGSDPLTAADFRATGFVSEFHGRLWPRNTVRVHLERDGVAVDAEFQVDDELQIQSVNA